MKFKDLAQLSAEERKNKRRELELELIKMNTQVATGTPPKNAGTVSRIKKDIARLMLLEKLSTDKEKSNQTTASKGKQPENKSTPKLK
jgi:ribosomal protein L29